MLRSWLALFLLTNYLVVVGAGLVNQSERPRLSAEHPYVHSAECQQRNYLRLDCFETCQDDQHAVRKKADSKIPPRHVLATMKGVDVHCLAAELPPTPFMSSRRLAAGQSHFIQPKSAGFGGKLYPPPRQG